MVVVFAAVVTTISFLDAKMILSFFEFITILSEFRITCGFVHSVAGVIPNGKVDDSVMFTFCWSVYQIEDTSLLISSTINLL